MKVAIIGAGSWGTALAQVLAGAGHDACLCARKQEVAHAINTRHKNPRYLSNANLHARLIATTSFEDALCDARALVIVTPSIALRETAQKLASFVPFDLPIVVCSKGIEAQSGKTPIQILEDELKNKNRLAVLSGPNHAEEVIFARPCATVVASAASDCAQFFQTLFATEAFRVYTSDDVCGVELCAAFKNVVAIAVGISYGLDFGDNTAAMLITRGLAEMSRIVSASGGKASTCMGLSGAGDMIATCMSAHSRNRRFGEMLARGGTLSQFEEETHMVAEGAQACKNFSALAKAVGVELPIANVVRSVVWEDANVREVALALAQRPLKSEF